MITRYGNKPHSKKKFYCDLKVRDSLKIKRMDSGSGFSEIEVKLNKIEIVDDMRKAVFRIKIEGYYSGVFLYEGRSKIILDNVELHYGEKRRGRRIHLGINFPFNYEINVVRGDFSENRQAIFR